MSQLGMSNFLSLSGSLTNVGTESRQFRLPTMPQFPKLDGGRVRAVNRPAQSVRAGAVIIGGTAGSLPEMATDVIDMRVSYSIENVKRQRDGARLWSQGGVANFFGRMLGSHRASRA
jgi:hypothetical protein